MDQKWKQLLQEEMKRDADHIMEEVNSDPTLKDVEAPEIVHERLFQQIREYEEQKNRATLSAEDKELIRLGQKYKRNRKRTKYLVLVAAIIAVLGIGVTSFGGPKRIWKDVEGMLAGKEQIYTDNGRMEEGKTTSEAEAYEQIEEEFGFYPVKMNYMPADMKFLEINLWKEMQNVQLNYEGKTKGTIKYRMIPNYRTNSIGTDVEDTLIQEYEKEVKGVVLEVKQYVRGESNEEKWNIKFEFEDVQYILLIGGLEQKEVEKIIENLDFYS